MAEKINKSLVFIGLPESGKTSFIAALWSFLKAINNDSGLKLDCLPTQREYVEKLANEWRRCNLLQRNRVGSYEKVEFSVNATDGSQYSIHFPDVAGEMYVQQFANREITDEYYRQIANADGIVLFINPQTLKDITSHNQFGDASQSETQSESPINYEIANMPQRIQIVDLLQIILKQKEEKCNIAVIISAWDLIVEDITPDRWIEINLPFVSSFIKYNFNQPRYYGISAQGGDYKGNKDELLEKPDPLDRIIVVEDIEKTNNIIKPIQWLLEN